MTPDLIDLAVLATLAFAAGFACGRVTRLRSAVKPAVTVYQDGTVEVHGGEGACHATLDDAVDAINRQRWGEGQG